MSSFSCSSSSSSSPSHSLVDSNASAQQQQHHSQSLLSQHRYAPTAHSLLLGSAPTSFLTRGAGGRPFASSSRPSPMDIISIIDETLDIIGDDFSPSHMDTISSPSRGHSVRRMRRQRQQQMDDESSCDSNDSDSHNNKFGSQHSRQ
mmetsp:Transcript_2608/g.7147  ORF Transcript_2608/g.7147 Transcript_2608/m.7147 type:complete len:147 (-) Transcript_2608:1461-1901(-)